jgi:hypothetical protein
LLAAPPGNSPSRLGGGQKFPNMISNLHAKSAQISPFPFFQPCKMKGIPKSLKDFPIFAEKIDRADDYDYHEFPG